MDIHIIREYLHLLCTRRCQSLGKRGEGKRYLFIPRPKDEYTLQNIVINGGELFLISDIYIRDKDASQVAGNEELRIIDVLYRSDE